MSRAGEPLVLGIETSCDETSVAVLRGRRVRSHLIASQDALHRRFGGVVPELASRRHLERLTPMIEAALRDARAVWRDLDAIAVTSGPGLIGALLVGTVTAQAIAAARDLPCYGVNHLEGHLWAADVEEGFVSRRGRPSGRPAVGLASSLTPCLALIVSGGHSDLIVAEAPGRYRTLGRTRDDAAGEAFDKVGKMLRLGYPGGPAVDRAAARGRADAVDLPRPYLPDSWDFSFSGLKTAVARLIEARGPRAADVAASFQEAVVDVLLAKMIRAVAATGIRRVVVGGGVASNSRLRARLAEASEAHGWDLRLPSRRLCTDNAAMIARVGVELVRRGARPARSLRARSEWPLGPWPARHPASEHDRSAD